VRCCVVAFVFDGFLCNAGNLGKINLRCLLQGLKEFMVMKVERMGIWRSFSEKRMTRGVW